ncbi:hypothetical protein J7K43_04245 [Candidatus Calescamantes bacterium]|nr:hypothetical protein [Candidatus Calescamantes bacterium]
MKGSIWMPLSSNAYGANAVFIPQWGKKRAVEFILVMTQNYPVYKTHPVLDVFHSYTTGMERFESNYNFRVLGWEIDKNCKRWSFLYLPVENPAIRTTAIFIPAEQGNMRLFLDMENPSEKKREWEFHLYVSSYSGISLSGYKKISVDKHNIVFLLENTRIELASRKLEFYDLSEIDSNFWINFPLNANEFNPEKRKKKRLLIKIFPVVMDAYSSNTATIDFITDASKKVYVKKPDNFPVKNCPDLSYRHLWWETLHNREYAKSFKNNSMTDRVIPGREWSKFFIWDAGMIAVGAIEEDEEIAERIIEEMPDPEKMGDKVFNYGSFIPTALFALWELYQKTGDKSILHRHYKTMKNLVVAMYFYPFRIGDIRHDGMVRPVRNRTGVDDYPALVYADGWPFAWDYKETLPLNSSRKFQQIISVGMTCLAIRLLKILRLIAYIIGRKEDISCYTGWIEKSEEVMNKNYWDEEKGVFLNRLESEKKLLDIEGVYEYLPLFSGSVDNKRRKVLLKKLLDRRKYWTPYGITVVARDNPNYREDGYWNGGIWIPTQWFFWKAFYNLGMVDMAKTIADLTIELWDTNHKKTLCCWEKFCVKNGLPAGNSRFSGLSTPLLALWSARRKKGRIQVSQEVLIERQGNVQKGVYEFTIISPFYSGPCGLSIVTGEKNARYYIQDGDGNRDTMITDKFGYAGFSVNVFPDKPLIIRIFPER